MKVLLVSNGYPPRGRYGTEFYTRELVRALRDAGDEPHVLHPVRTGSNPRYSLTHVVEDGVPVALLENAGHRRAPFLESYADQRAEAVFAEHLSRLRPDVCHFVYLLWGLSVRLPRIAAVAGVPSVATLTDYGLLCHRGQMFDARLENCGGPRPASTCARCIRTPTPYDVAPGLRALKGLAAEGFALLGGIAGVPTTRDLETREQEVRAALEAVTRLIAPTESLARVFERGGVARERLVHLPYAFDEGPYHAVRDARRAGEEGPRRFGFLGQLAPHKDPATLLEAAELLARERPDADFEVVLHGSAAGHRARRYAPDVLARHRCERVRLEPPFPSDEAPRVLAGLDALVLPSLWDENAPLSLLQARAAGVPVLASDVPGSAEVMPRSPHGMLFPPGDAASLARCMAAVLDERVVPDPEGRLPVSLAEHVARVRELHAAVAGKREG